MKLKTVNSSLITWSVMFGDKHDDWLVSYCADGDGIVQLVDYGQHFELVDQLETVKTWKNDGSEETVLAILEECQNYLAATYHEIFEEARHFENAHVSTDLSDQSN